jgi:hypothetical protein
MIRAVADTHAVLWYLYNDARLSRIATEVMDSAEKGGAGPTAARLHLCAPMPGHGDSSWCAGNQPRSQNSLLYCDDDLVDIFHLRI